MRPLWLLVLAVFLAPALYSPIGLAAAQSQGQARVIRTLAMGKAESTPVLAAWLVTEPSTEPTIIATREWGGVSGTDIRRYMRIYFPRTYEELLEYEFIFLAQVDMSFVSPEQARWIYDALRDYPKGAVNTRSIMSAVSTYYTQWRDSILPEAFPNDVEAVIADIEGRYGPLIVKDDPSLPSIMRPYRSVIEDACRSYGGANTVPRPGSVVLSYIKTQAGLGSPIPGQVAHVFYWRWNRSTTFTFMDMVYDPFWSAPANNPYALDIIVNMIWWSTGRELPQDPLMVHDYRSLVSDYTIQKSLLTSLLDFAEVFGADSSGIYARAEETEGYRRKAAGEYLDRDFAAAHDTMGKAMSGLEALEDDAMKLKDRALFWVYVVQWLATTGVFMMAIIVLWSLMVRRSLYREVTTTRWDA